MTTTNLIECPKCFGVGRFEQFANVHAGTCFLCAGKGRVAQQVANKWIRAQMGTCNAAAEMTEGPRQVSNAPARKRIARVFDSIGPAMVTVLGGGAFSISFGEGAVIWVETAVDGRIVCSKRDDGHDHMTYGAYDKSRALLAELNRRAKAA